MINLIFNEDCLEGMKRIPDGSVDFVLCDLPFGITSNDWDKCIDLEKFWQEINRLTKINAAVALFANGKFVFELGNSNLKNYRYKWCIEKHHSTGFLNAKKMPLKCHEDILIFYQELPLYNPQYFYNKPYEKKRPPLTSSNYRRTFSDSLSISDDGRRYPRDVLKINYPYTQVKPMFHPTQKPTDLLEYLIKTYTNEGETVLDATIGSGSTAVACINTNRNFIGFELDEHYFEVACDRIQKAQDEKALKLFT